MSVLITGIGGFIGSHLAERLHDLGQRVIGIDNFCEYYPAYLKKMNAEELKKLDIEVVEGDIRNGSVLKKLPEDIDFIFHLAAQPGLSQETSFDSYFSNNVLGTYSLIEYAKGLAGLKLFVNISTSSVYGKIATKKENEAPEPVSWYGVTKLAAEQLVMAESRGDSSLKACSLRLYSVYGPRERPDKLFTRLISCAFNNTCFPLYKGSEKHLRSFTYVDDIVDGMVQAIEKCDDVVGNVINLGSDREHSTAEGIKCVEKITESPVPIETKPPRNGDQLRTCADISLARRLLKYSPDTTLQEGVAKQVAWYKDKFVT
ncbi:GDP-mannose 4,6-dehydratase [Marinilabiliaceae bacterium ANBcel2]|nr:GDP-mannose 4,6-dehydratase [Marinilabiliaceae bacterium ANBcel2]